MVVDIITQYSVKERNKSLKESHKCGADRIESV